MSERNEQFVVDAAPRLEVSLRSGEVNVLEGPPGAVQIRIDGPHPELLTVSQTGPNIVVRQDLPQSWFESPINRGSYAVSILSPPGARLEASLASADLAAAVQLEYLQAETASGDVRIGEISGDAEVKTASGDVRIDKVAGELRFSSASGELRVGRLGAGTLSTASGDLVADQADGSADVKTASGTVRFTRFTGPALSVKTVSGDVSVGIPAGTELSFEANTMSGRVVLPDPSPDEQPVERACRIAFRSVSGDLRIRRA